jgi:nitroreductase
MDIFEAMETCRAIRRLKPDPVPDHLLQQLVYYATRAPSAGNAQLWRFLVVTDETDRQFLGETFRRAMADRLPPPPATEDKSPQARGLRAFRDFVLGFERVPAVILTCVENGYPLRGEPNPIFMWSTIYPATQNLLLAARAMGLGAAMTTLHIVDEPAIRAHFGIPGDVGIGATVPVGYPAGRYGPVNRRPVREVTYWGRWAAVR